MQADLHLGGGIAAHVRARPDEEHRPPDAIGQHDLPAQRQPQPSVDAHAQRQVACAGQAHPTFAEIVSRPHGLPAHSQPQPGDGSTPSKPLPKRTALQEVR